MNPAIVPKAVLVVDADDPVASFICEVLRGLEYQACAVGESEAAAMLRDTEITVDLLITDRPQELLSIRPLLPVLYAASLVDDQLIDQNSGRLRYLSKPFLPDQLEKAVAEILSLQYRSARS
jgi:CheY-like chemotaxis protein